MPDRVAGVYFCRGDDPKVMSPFDKHPCVVVLEITGSKDAIVVPAFTHGRDTIEKLIAFYVEQGESREDLSARMDNREAIEWSSPVDAVSDVEWAVLQFDRIPLASLDKAKRVGTMNSDSFLVVVQTLLRFAETAPGQSRLSPHVLKKLRQLV